MNIANESIRLVVSSAAEYSARLAGHVGEIHAAQALRFNVFNLELKEAWRSTMPLAETKIHSIPFATT